MANTKLSNYFNGTVDSIYIWDRHQHLDCLDWSLKRKEKPNVFKNVCNTEIY